MRTISVKNTAACYAGDLSRLVALAGHDTVLAMTPELVARYFTTLSEGGLKMSSLARKRASLGSFIMWGARQKLWQAGDLLLAIPKIKRPHTLPRPFSVAEADRLMGLELDGDERVFRSLLFFTGLRVSPICSLRVSDVCENPPQIRATSKGAKQQVIPMHPKLEAAVLHHILSQHLKPQDPLLRRRDGRVWTRHYAEKVTRRWGQQAGVLGCKPHRFRHTYATNYLVGNPNAIRELQEALGHASLTSTQIYTEVTPDRIRAGNLKLPDSWR